MEVKIQLKHLIIFGLVIFYTFASILFALTNQIYNRSLDVAFIYNATELGVENDANQIWESMNRIQKSLDFTNLNTHYNSMNFQNVNVSQKMSDHIDEYAIQNNVIVLYGDTYNASISKVIKNNPQTEFLMIDSKFGPKFSNLTKIEIDNTNKLQVIANDIKKTSKTKKILLVGSEEDILNKLDDFKSEIEIDDSYEITTLIFDDSRDNVSIKKKLLKEFNQGYDTVYVTTRELNKIVIETAQEVQKEIISNRQEVDEENTQILMNQANAKSAENQSNEDNVEKDNINSSNSNENSNELQDGNSDVEQEQKLNLENLQNADAEKVDSSDLEKVDSSDSKKVNSTDNDEQEKIEYQYEQALINVYVNGNENISSGIYYTDDTNSETSNVVRAYIELNIEDILDEYFEAVINNSVQQQTFYLGFNNGGLELLKE